MDIQKKKIHISEGRINVHKFNKERKEVTFECWPRYQDVRNNNAKQFKGWPITVSL